jgi:hypothetical protein
MKPVPPPLSELLARYLDRQASAHQEGLGFADPCGEVVPFDAVPVQPVEPRLAWEEARDALRYFPADGGAPALAPPPEWPALVAGHEPEVALAFCLGNFPQMVRHLPALLEAPEVPTLCRPDGRPTAAPSLADWARQVARQGTPPQTLLAAGVLRLAREFNAAEELLRRHRASAPPGWQAAWANEEAALAWHRGAAEDAAALWQAQAESVPVLFNRGVAAVFRNRPAEACAALAAATAQLPDDSAWHHLGRLYLALAEMRR